MPRRGRCKAALLLTLRATRLPHSLEAKNQRPVRRHDLVDPVRGRFAPPGHSSSAAADALEADAVAIQRRRPPAPSRRLVIDGATLEGNAPAVLRARERCV